MSTAVQTFSLPMQEPPVPDRYGLLYDRILVVNGSDGTQLNLSAVSEAGRYVEATGHQQFGLLITRTGDAPVMPDELARFMETRFRPELRVAWVVETDLSYRCLSVVVKLLESIQGRVFKTQQDALRWLRRSGASGSVSI